MKILVVDDEQILLDQLKAVFEDQRYMVETALDGEEALYKIRSDLSETNPDPQAENHERMTELVLGILILNR